jgi:hypothetical protein
MILHKAINLVINKNSKLLNMSKKIVVISVLTLIVLFLGSCNTYQRCPAYGAIEIKAINADNV